MTTTMNATLTPDQRMVESLRLHGAKVTGPDGSLVELNSFFVGNVMNDCIRMGCNAITYDLFLSETEEPLQIAIWKNGHVDAGSAENIARCLDR